MRLPFLDLVRIHWDRVAAIACLALGVLALVLGYVGVSNKVYTVEQIPYVISGGLAGLLLLGVAATLYLSADLRDEWRKLNELQHDVAAMQAPSPVSVEEMRAELAALRRRVDVLETLSEPDSPGTRANGNPRAARTRRTPSAGSRA
jgi:hypothetical protein